MRAFLLFLPLLSGTIHFPNDGCLIGVELYLGLKCGKAENGVVIIRELCKSGTSDSSSNQGRIKGAPLSKVFAFISSLFLLIFCSSKEGAVHPEVIMILMLFLNAAIIDNQIPPL